MWPSLHCQCLSLIPTVSKQYHTKQILTNTSTINLSKFTDSVAIHVRLLNITKIKCINCIALAVTEPNQYATRLQVGIMRVVDTCDEDWDGIFYDEEMLCLKGGASPCKVFQSNN